MMDVEINASLNKKDLDNLVDLLITVTIKRTIGRSQNMPLKLYLFKRKHCGRYFIKTEKSSKKGLEEYNLIPLIYRILSC